ncbi:hypothetical protein, partial [Parabacteroides sp. 52]
SPSSYPRRGARIVLVGVRGCIATLGMYPAVLYETPPGFIGYTFFRGDSGFFVFAMQDFGIDEGFL